MKDFTMIIISLLVMGCNSISYEEMNENREISVTFNLNVNSVISGSLNQTKSKDIGINETINNLWVIQFDGTGDDAEVVGVPQYIEQYKPHSFVNLSQCTTTNRVLFLANTYDPALFKSVGKISLKNILTKCYSIGNQYDILYDGSVSILSGYIDCVIGAATTNIGACSLSRNYSVIEFCVVNNTSMSSSPIIIDSLSVFNVPSRVSYWYGSPVSDMYSDLMIGYSGIQSETNGNTTTYSFIMPANRQGTVSNSDENMKNNFAGDNATYVILSAQTSSGQGLEYTFYLGDNLKNDFNICENMHYQYSIELNGVGNPTVDCRVKRLPGLSNCYLTKTNTAVSVKLGKVDQFWGDNGYENVPEYTLGSDKEWTAEVLWADFPLTNITLTKDNGTGVNDYFTCVSSVEGNALIAVKVDGVTVWSYHIWICDEDLEAKSVMWNGVRFMDRNIGALSTEFSTSNFYYQYGRKDPFPGDQTIYGIEKTFISNPLPGRGADRANVPFTINNPTVVISYGLDGMWTFADKYHPIDPEGIIWNDFVSISGTVDAANYKSIFDPCPAGWKVPQYECYSLIGNLQYDYSKNSTVYSSSFEFPMTGYLDSYSQTVQNREREALYMTVTPYSVISAYSLKLYTYVQVYNDSSTPTSYGGVVRCIKE